MIQYYQWQGSLEHSKAQLADSERGRNAALQAANSQAELTRRIEAQKPFLERKLALFFETIQVAGRLTELQLDPDDPRWKSSAKRFWELRWAELEMVGDPGIRDAARRVGQQIVETEFNKLRERHDLRWAVECLADELRMALEHAWGTDRNATRQSANGLEIPISKLPNGCTQGRQEPYQLSGMEPLFAPNNNRIFGSR
jgi:hypothetical protein